VNIYALSSLLASISCFTVGLFVFLRDKSKNLNQSFTLIAALAGAWTSFPFLISLPEEESTAVFIARIVYMFAAFVPFAFYNLVLTIVGLEKEKRERRVLAILLLSSLFFAFLSLSPNFIKGVLRHQPFFVVIPGPLYPPFMAFMGLGSGYAFYKCFEGYRVATGSKRNQLKYMLLAFAFAHAGALFHFLGAYLKTEPFPHDFLLIIFALTIAYAIIKHRLMDITVVVSKGVAYSLILGLITIPIYLAIIISHRATVNAIPPLAAGTLVFACGLWIVLQNPRAMTNRMFGLVCLGASIWLFSFFMLYSSPSGTDALLWGKLSQLGSVYIPAYFYHFAMRFSGLPGHRRAIFANYIISTFFLLLLPTDYYFEGHYQYSWGYYPRAGTLLPLFLLYFALVYGLALHRLYKSQQASAAGSPLETTRKRYVFWAFAIAGIATLDYAQCFGADFYPPGFFFVTLWIGLVTYAIGRYKLLDISLVLTKARLLPYVGAVALLSLMYLIILGVVRAFTGLLTFLLAGVLVAVFTVFSGLLVEIEQRIEQAVGRALFRKRHDAFEALSTFATALVTILDFRILTHEIVRTLTHVLEVRSATLYLLDKEKDLYLLTAVSGSTTTPAASVRLGSTDPFPRHLATVRTPLVREELEQQAVSTPTDDLAETLAELDAAVCIPLINQDRLIGFCNLGPRIDRRMYSDEDLRLLTTLGQNAAIALDNAMLYEDLRRSQALMRRTDRLRSLEIIAGGFAHEIRNPLTSIKTFIQLAPERKDDREFMGTFSSVVAEDVHRIERLIQEILDYARYMEPKFTEEDLNDIVGSCLYFVDVKAESKSIAIEKDLDPDLPLVLADRQQIKQVLLNLFLNAMDAMDATGGRLIVKTHRLTKSTGAAWVQIEVTDTGGGIPADNLEHIFDPFYTTKHESGEHVGTGLGLTIVHQIIQEHHGTIEVNSTAGMGTTFFVNLPVNPVLCGPSQGQRTHETTDPAGR